MLRASRREVGDVVGLAGAFVRGQMPDEPAILPGRASKMRAAETQVDERVEQLRKDWGPDPDHERVGICCSGGGLRSAAFNLGALQLLQRTPYVPSDTGAARQERRRSVMRSAKYLSAVSGGSYIAAALWMVQKQDPQEEDPAKQVRPEWFDPDRDGMPPFAPRSPEERYLRNHTAYLAAGLRGRTRLLTHLVLGLTLNLVMVGALLYLAAVPLGLIATVMRPELTANPQTAAPDGLARVAVIVVLSIAFAGFACGLWTTSRHSRSERRQALLLRTAKVLTSIAAVAAASLFALPWLLERLRAAVLVVGGTGASSGDVEGSQGVALLLTITTVLGLPTLAQGVLRAWLEKSGTTVFARLRAWLASPQRAALVAAPLLLSSLFLLFYNVVVTVGWQPVQLVYAGAAVAVLLTLYAAFDPTASSMYPFYKRRLCTAFALQRDPDSGDAKERPYHGVPVKMSETRIDGWPELVVCAAANVSDEGATPTGRNAVPFTFTAELVGGDEVGYVNTADFEKAMGDKRVSDITLPAAVAMSGAALAPSMGKLSTSTSAKFLLALANARLGVWLPNPAHVTRFKEVRPRGFRENWPRPRMTWLLREMWGANRKLGKYLYVSDGGHYENLGLVELLRRGCTTIYCFDASGDEEGSYATIGQAIALARSDLGVEIDMQPGPLRTLDEDSSLYEGNVAVIPFSYMDDRGGVKATGRIVYGKCALTPTDSWDLRAFRSRDAQFPNHSTGEQHYDYERFEAYRALGYRTAALAQQTYLEELGAQTRTNGDGGGGANGTNGTNGANGANGAGETSSLGRWLRPVRALHDRLHDHEAPNGSARRERLTPTPS